MWAIDVLVLGLGILLNALTRQSQVQTPENTLFQRCYRRSAGKEGTRKIDHPLEAAAASRGYVHGRRSASVCPRTELGKVDEEEPRWMVMGLNLALFDETPDKGKGKCKEGRMKGLENKGCTPPLLEYKLRLSVRCDSNTGPD